MGALMPDDTPIVEQINVPLTPPSEGRLATWTYGFYIVKDDTLTMTDQSGKPAVDSQGKTYSQKLDCESPRIIAARLTKKLRLGLQAKNPGAVAGFNRQLIYPPLGLA